MAGATSTFLLIAAAWRTLVTFGTILIVFFSPCIGSVVLLFAPIFEHLAIMLTWYRFVLPKVVFVEFNVRLAEK